MIMAKTTKTVQQRIANVSSALVRIAKELESKPERARTANPMAKRALDEGRTEKPDSEWVVKQVAPATNSIDEKTEALDKMINGLLSAINRKNVNNVKTLLKSVIKKIQEIEAISKKQLQPLVASSKTKASALETKARVDKSLRRATATVRRAQRLLGV
jgi:hypothetical protein